MNKDLLVWIDTETTGLYEDFNMMGMHKHKILEVAVLITDSNFNKLDEGINIIIHHDINDLNNLMNDYVKNMHEKHGLLKQVEESKVELTTAKKMILDYFNKHELAPKSSPICGNSISFDKIFLLAQMPEVVDMLHYRTIDVSSFKEVINRKFPEVKELIQKKETHRALDDINESLEEMKIYSNFVLNMDEKISKKTTNKIKM